MVILLMVIDGLKTSWHRKNLWHAMTNIGAINSKHIKIYDVTKNHGLP
jgi:hypothetical protein